MFDPEPASCRYGTQPVAPGKNPSERFCREAPATSHNHVEDSTPLIPIAGRDCPKSVCIRTEFLPPPYINLKTRVHLNMGMAAATADVQANGDLLISVVLCSFGNPFVRPVHLPLICTRERYMDNLTGKQNGIRQRIGSKKHHLK